MKGKIKVFSTATLVATLLFSLESKAGVITSVTNYNSIDAADVYAIGTLSEDVDAFIDRPHEYNGIPGLLNGIDFVQVANDDKRAPNLRIEVTVSSDSILYLFIDNRILDPMLTNPALSGTMKWVIDDGFMDTSLDIEIDEGGDGDIENTSSIFSRYVSAGSVTTFAQNDGGNRNMYGIAAAAAAAVPEPSIITLFVLGLVGLSFARRRKV